MLWGLMKGRINEEVRRPTSSPPPEWIRMTPLSLMMTAKSIMAQNRRADGYAGLA